MFSPSLIHLARVHSFRLLALLFFTLPFLLMAQLGEVQVSLTPPDGWENGDAIEISIEYGTEDNPIGEITEVQFEIVMPEGVRISSQSEISILGEGSWFAFDDNWSGTTESLRDGEILLLSLFRTNNQPVRGYGEIAVLRGVIVEIDEIHMKSGLTANASVINLEKGLGYEFSYFFTEQVIQVANAPESAQLEIVDMQGRVVLKGNAREGISMAQLPAQLWVLRLSDASGYLGHQKIVMQAQP